ncbi:hypothetical protein ACA910_000397 [Epithemia clementina (nom. ined.)]
MAILGAPGSGKGFYGNPLAQCLGFSMFSVSSILRHYRPQKSTTSKNNSSTIIINPQVLDSGALVDCQQVCDILVDFVLSHQQQRQDQQQEGHQAASSPKTVSGLGSAPSSLKTNDTTGGECLKQQQGVLLDGFPRTLLQIELMQEQWPIELQIQTAIHIHVPDSVCQAKMLGRRVCSICQRPFNVASVHWDGFDLPALVPDLDDPECVRHFGKFCQPALLPLLTTRNNGGDSEPVVAMNDKDLSRSGLEWWTQRKDDSNPTIVMERLRLHREHEEPILQHYRQQGRLFTYTPKRGIKNIPDMQQSLQAWMSQLPSLLSVSPSSPSS